MGCGMSADKGADGGGGGEPATAPAPGAAASPGAPAPESAEEKVAEHRQSSLSSVPESEPVLASRTDSQVSEPSYPRRPPSSRRSSARTPSSR